MKAIAGVVLLSGAYLVTIQGGSLSFAPVNETLS